MEALEMPADPSSVSDLTNSQLHSAALRKDGELGYFAKP
jgi:hypothetical protein